jgi:hypothetical protein
MSDDALRDLHARYRARLEALLTAPDAPRQDELTRATYAVFDPAALADPELREATEGWLAELVGRTAPRSDPIFERAVAAFGWTEASGEADPRLADVAARLAARRPGASRAAPEARQPVDRPGSDVPPPLIAPPRIIRRRRQPLGYWAGGVLAVVLVGGTGVVVLSLAGPRERLPVRTAYYPPPSRGPQESAAPQVVVGPGRVDINMASTETADSYIRCDQVAADQLQGCQVERTSMSDNGVGALDYLKTLRLDAADASTLQGARDIAVHVHWRDVT